MLLVLLNPALAAWPTPPEFAAWESVQRGDVQIDCATVDGNRWCKALSFYPTSITNLKAVITKFEEYPRHFEHVDQVEWLDADTAYLHVDYPKPLDDRDYIARFVSAGKGDIFTVQWHAVDHSARPPIAGTVRLPRAAGRWTLTTVPGGTRVQYEWEGDLEGDIPGWIMKRAAEIHGNEIFEGLAKATGVTPVATGAQAP